MCDSVRICELFKCYSVSVKSVCNSECKQYVYISDTHDRVSVVCWDRFRLGRPNICPM